MKILIFIFLGAFLMVGCASTQTASTDCTEVKDEYGKKLCEERSPSQATGKEYVKDRDYRASDFRNR